ncbi:hypothetical protein BDF19DRAFT_412501 [Syncephalis fuscata]|nr:hypothetical protein BDF19DRAFT_412501 [Syncephalis fuscata]
MSRALSPSLLRASRGEVAAFNIGPSSMMSHGPRKSIDHSTNYQQQNMANTANYTNQQPSIPNSRLKTTSTTNATNIRQRATSSPSLNLNDLFMPPTNDTTTNANNNNNNSSSSSSNNNNNNNMASVYSPLPRRTSSGGAVTSIGGGASMHLPTNTTLRILRLNDNAIDDTGALHLSRALLKHPGLRRIDLADNRISDIGITELLDAIYESGRPRTLHIRGNSSVSRELQYEVSGLAREAAIYADQLGEPMTDDESSPSTDNTDSDNDGDGDGGNEGNSSWLDEYELGDELDNLTLPVYHSRNDRNGHTSKKEMSTLFKR